MLPRRAHPGLLASAATSAVPVPAPAFTVAPETLASGPASPGQAQRSTLAGRTETRLRKTQYVHPWYSRTMGVKITATTVMIDSV